MAESDKASSASDEVIDDATHSAAGIRKAALWMAGALGGIPALAVLGALVRAPGDQGFDNALLGWGIVLCATGAVIGVLAFAYVITPVPISNSWLDTKAFDITRVPGQPFVTWPALLTSLADVRSAHANAEIGSSDATVYSKMADAALAQTEIALASAKATADANPGNAQATAALNAATASRNAARLDAQAKAAEAAAVAENLALLARQRDAREGVRSKAFLLAASDEVAARYIASRFFAGLAAAVVALGIYLLATAPLPKPAESELSLVTLRLSAAGMEAIGCNEPTLQAIRIGGDDAVPRVITIPTDSCPAKLVDFTISKVQGLGELTDEEPISAPTTDVNPT
jgi:hypothetical protein